MHLLRRSRGGARHSVGGSVALTVCRGGAAVERTVRVDGLHPLTPSRYIEFGGAVLNELSYQQARNHAMAVRGCTSRTPATRSASRA